MEQRKPTACVLEKKVKLAGFEVVPRLGKKIVKLCLLREGVKKCQFFRGGGIPLLPSRWRVLGHVKLVWYPNRSCGASV